MTPTQLERPWRAALDLLDSFLDGYVTEFDYYERTARRAAEMLKSDLQAAGIRSIVTSRAKFLTGLAEKCRQRNKQRACKTIDDIYSDIVDLAGVRVALYFPGERKQVGGMISQLFHEYQPSKDFPDSSESSSGMRFKGYSATHYRVRLKPDSLDESEQRYASANIEIQVASLLMHAWTEVEHELIYKPTKGELSAEEYSLLDQLNGLVHAGEIALEQVQRAGEIRVATGGRRFANHFELAAHLLSQVSAVNEKPVTESGLGRVDLLFELLTRLDRVTPDALHPYLELLHGDLEQRPLSEQIIDALIAEDESLYDTYRSVRADAEPSKGERATPDDAVYLEIGQFLGQWVQLERLLREVIPEARQTMPTTRMLEKAELLDSGRFYRLDQLRRIRNQLVHGIEVPPPGSLDRATQLVAELIGEIKHRRQTPKA